MQAREHGNPAPHLRHAWRYALPGGHMPPVVMCEGQRYVHVSTFKHDFFAATGLYEAPASLTVLKMGRTTPILALPAGWIGRLLARREIRLYRLLQDLPNIPRLTGAVGAAGIMHSFVPGRPLRREDRVSDTFFPELEHVLAAIHARHMAYVDLNKRENILLGDDGRPYLIDFQISLHLPPTGWRRLPPVRWFLLRFQEADRYHLAKHKRRLRPDQLRPEELASLERLSVWIRLHRLIARPLTQLRRKLLAFVGRGDKTTVPGSSAK